MYLYLHFFSCFLQIHAVIDNEIIVDYFIHKHVSRVIGYSCNFLKDDISLIRQLSDKGITSLIFKLRDNSSIGEIARTDYWKLGIFLDTRCYTMETVVAFFSEATDYRLYDELRDWFILGNELNYLLNVTNDRAFGVSTDFKIAILNDQQNYRLYDVYNRYKNRETSLNVTFYGSWNKQKNFTIDVTQSKLARRSNFHNWKLTAGFYKMPLSFNTSSHSFQFNEDPPNGIEEALSKYGYIILRHLGDIYNFSTVDCIRFECFETETLKPGDTLGSLVRALINSEADLGGTPISITAKRSYLVKYIHMGLPFRTCFIFRNPQPMAVKMQEILQPFVKNVWYLTFSTTLMAILMFNSTIVDDQINFLVAISTSFIITIGALCQQSSNVYLRNFSTRLVFFSTLVFSLLLYNYYSASVVSVRLDKPIYKINDSLVELAKLKLKMASEKVTHLNILFKAFSSWELKVFYENYWTKLREEERWMDSKSGMQLVQQGGFAYHVYPDVGYVFIEKHFSNAEICELMEVHLGRPQNNMFTVSSNCTFVELLRVGLTKISEVGIRRRQIDKWRLKKPKCRKDILSASSINIYEFASHLIILVVGILIAVCVLLIEVVHFQRGFSFKDGSDKQHQRSNVLFINM